MQIIGTRPHSMFRVPDTYFRDHPTFTPGIDPTTGGPVAVVDDYTDTVADAGEGKQWIVDTDPASPDYRSVIKVDL